VACCAFSARSGLQGVARSWLGMGLKARQPDAAGAERARSARAKLAACLRTCARRRSWNRVPTR